MALIQLLLVATLLPTVRPQRAWAIGDPTIDWRTLETPHFRVHFDERNRQLAERAARLAEEAHTQLAPLFGVDFVPPTDMVIVDDADIANGSARSVPYNLIRIYAMAPEANSTLGDSDDWLRGVIIHEYIHILHINTASGVWDVINAVLGKTYMPNGALPRWYIEGIATYGESVFTEGGRLRNNAYRMYLRMDALGGRFYGVENLAGVPLEWPGATAWYLYGSDFIEYVSRQYGADRWWTFQRRVGAGLSPLAINAYARDIFGRDILALWGEYEAAAQGEFFAEAVAVSARGETPLTPVTDRAFLSGYPRCRGPREVGYVRSDGVSQSRLVTHDPASGESHDLVDVFGQGSFDWSPDGRWLVFTQSARYQNIYSFNDLFRYDADTGVELRLTEGERAREPAVSPDGRRIAFVGVNDGGGVDLRELELASGRVQTLVPAPQFQLASMPDYSPDGRFIVYSWWMLDWGRDLFLYDRTTGATERLTEDRAQDLEPSFAPDGRSVLFASDRTGIFNIFRLDLETGRVTQLSNVLGGAFSPRQCVDGGPVWVRSYGPRGYDIAFFAPDGEAPAPAPYQRPEFPYPRADALEIVEEDYNPWPELYPRSWSPTLSSDGDGLLVGGAVAGADPLFHHLWAASFGYTFGEGTYSWAVSYNYSQLPFDVGAFASRASSTAARRLVAESRFIPFEEESIAAGLTLTFPFYDDHSGHAFSLRYAFRNVRQLDEVDVDHDPGDIQPRLPEFGRFDEVSLGWFWSDARRFAHAISTAEGSALNVQLTLRSPIVGADFESVSLQWGVRHYLRNPLFDRHVLALLLMGGIGRASFGNRPLFSVGGLPDADIILQIIDETPIGGGFLRGYESFAQIGSQFYLLNAEYRVPLVDVDAGAFTLPAFLRNVYLAGFADYGTATDKLRLFDTFLLGVGAELRLEATLGYVLPTNFRLGYAHGFGEGGVDDVYVLVGSGF